MIRNLLSFFCIAFVSGCTSQFIEIPSILETRAPLASTLQEQGKYADALVQWKIISTANPDDELVESQISALEALISKKVEKLLAIAAKAETSGNKKSQRNAYLQTLALDPNNQTAIDALRQTEWKIAMEKANSKTQTIKEYFVESQEEAQRSILLTRFHDRGEQYVQGKKYTSLITLADEFESAFPSAKEPQIWRVLAYSKLADKSLAANDTEQAIRYNDIAISFAQKGSVESLVKKNQKLKKQMSDKHYKLAMRHFQTDLDKTIELLSRSLSFYSNNMKAKQQLVKATKIRDNLLKIKNMRR